MRVLAALVLLLVVPLGAGYHIDGAPTGETDPTGAPLTTADWVYAHSSIIVCESEGLVDGRNRQQTPNPGHGGLCTSGENDATGTAAPAGPPAANEYVRLDVCSVPTVTRNGAAGPFAPGLAEDQCTGGTVDDHAFAAEVGIFTCEVPTDQELYYRRLYAWWSYDGNGSYATDDVPGAAHAGGAGNEAAWHGHAAVFISPDTYAQNPAASQSGSVVTQIVPAVPGGVACGGSPPGGPVVVGGPRACVHDLTFTGDHDLRIVTSTGGAPTLATPHWRDDGCDGNLERRIPVAYAGTEQISFAGAITVETDVAATVTVDVTEDFMGTSVTLGPFAVPAGGASFLVSGTFPFSFAPRVDQRTLGLTWTFDLGVLGQQKQATRHPLYVLLEPPFGSAADMQLSLVHLSTDAARGQTTQEGVRDALWKRLKTLKVHGYKLDERTGEVREDKLLHYYRTATTCTNVTELLRTGDGQCGAWGEYFYDALAHHRIQAELLRVKVPAGTSAFLVKQQVLANDNPPPCAPGFPFDKATDGVKAPGQGGPNLAPATTRFGSHYVVRHPPAGGADTSHVYDSSYGTDFPSILLWEAGSVEGWKKSGADCYKQDDPLTREIVLDSVRVHQ